MLNSPNLPLPQIAQTAIKLVSPADLLSVLAGNSRPHSAPVEPNVSLFPSSIRLAQYVVFVPPNSTLCLIIVANLQSVTCSTAADAQARIAATGATGGSSAKRSSLVARAAFTLRELHPPLCQLRMLI